MIALLPFKTEYVNIKDTEVIKLNELQTKLIPATQHLEQIGNNATPIEKRFVQISNRDDAVDCFSADPKAFISLLTQVVLLKVQEGVQGLVSAERMAQLQLMEDPTLGVRQLIATQSGTNDLSAVESKRW